MVWLPDGEKSLRMFSLYSKQHIGMWQTGGDRTDGSTSCLFIHVER